MKPELKREAYKNFELLKLTWFVTLDLQGELWQLCPSTLSLSAAVF